MRTTTFTSNPWSGDAISPVSSVCITMTPSTEDSSALQLTRWPFIFTMWKAASVSSKISHIQTTCIAWWRCWMATRNSTKKLASFTFLKNKSASTKKDKSEFGSTVILARTSLKSNPTNRVTSSMKRVRWWPRSWRWWSTTRTNQNSRH